MTPAAASFRRAVEALTVDEQGLITTFVVMVRPLSGLIALAEAMGAPLAADGGT